MGKRNETWEGRAYKLNRMVNFKVMRYLLGRKRSFFSPFEGIVSRGKLDRIRRLESFVSEETAEKLSKSLGMELAIFSGEKRFGIIEKEGTKNDVIYLTEKNWKKYLDCEEALIKKTNGYDDKDVKKYVEGFNQRLETYLQEGLNLYNGKYEDMQLTRYAYFIMHGYTYNENYLERKYKQLIIDLNSGKINEVMQLEDSVMKQYYQALKKQMEKINAIRVFREEGLVSLK